MTRSRDNASNVAGDISGVTAGTGLTGGGSSGALTVSLDTPVSATNGGTAQTTFTTGDLLYASASNTLSKLSIGTTSQTLTVAGGVPSWATPSSGALTLISSTSVGSTVSSVTVSNAFSATYDNYLIKVSDINGSISTNATLKFGSTTTGYYSSGIYVNFNATTVTGYNVSNGSNFANILQYNGSDGCNMNVIVNAPYLSDNTTITSQVVSPTTTGYFMVNGGYLDNTTSYTAFTITPASGTLTGGTIKVYGFANS